VAEEEGRKGVTVTMIAALAHEKLINGLNLVNRLERLVTKGSLTLSLSRMGYQRLALGSGTKAKKRWKMSSDCAPAPPKWQSTSEATRTWQPLGASYNGAMS